MTYQSKYDAVKDEIEHRKILEIERYGLIMTTHHLIFESGKFLTAGRPAELVAFLGSAVDSFEPYLLLKKLRNIGKCRVDLIYYQDEFLTYDLPDRAIRIIKDRGVPFSEYEYEYDHDGNIVEGSGVNACHFSGVIPKAEGIALVETLNSGFRKARNLFEEKINAKARAEREEKARSDKESIAFWKGIREL
jgi:hypothetical protein